MVQATATSRSVRTSAQKAGLVLDLIRGKNVTERSGDAQVLDARVSAKSIHKLLKSAIANAEQAEGFGGDVERLYVSAATPTRARRTSASARPRWAAPSAS